MANTPTTWEQKWPSVILTPIVVANHVVTVSDTAGLHTKAKISLSAIGQETIDYEIKRVLSDTQLSVGLIGTGIEKLENPTQFNGGMLTMSEQMRNKFGNEIVMRAVYEEEPATALRNVLVNKYGAFLDTVVGVDGLNRLAVDAEVTVSSVTVDLDALTPPTRSDPDNVLIAGSEDGTKTGLKHAARVDSDLDLRVGISDGANKAQVNAGRELSVTDADTHTGLAAILAALGSVQVDMDALTPPTRVDPDNVLIAGSEDGTKTGLKHAARVDSDLDLRTGISDGANKAQVNASRELSVTDADTHTGLAAILAALSSVQVDLDALTPPTRVDPDNVLIVGSEDGTISGFKRAIKVEPDSSLDVVDFINSGNSLSSNIIVGTSAIEAKLGSSPLANRRSLTVTNLGTATIYWGYSVAVTILTGTPIVKKQQAAWTVGEDQPVYLISSVAGNDVRITEGA